MADNQNVSAEIAKLKKAHERLVGQLGADSKAAKKAKMKLDAAEKKQASQLRQQKRKKRQLNLRLRLKKRQKRA